MSDDFPADRIGSALAGTNPTVLRRLDASFAVIGDRQHLPGYCVLLTDTPGTDQLTDLTPSRQLRRPPSAPSTTICALGSAQRSTASRRCVVGDVRAS